MDDFIINNGVLVRYSGKDPHAVIPEGVTKIASRAFYGCRNLISVIVPETVKRIEYAAFEFCENLEQITLAPDLTDIGARAFWGTAWLKAQPPLVIINNAVYEYKGDDRQVVIPDGVTAICENAFDCWTLTDITIPDSVTVIGKGAFENCMSLTRLRIPDSVTVIPPAMCRYCHRLTEVILGDRVTSIGEMAFASCDFASITIPDSVTSIGYGAFASCRKLMSITLPDGITEIPHGLFRECCNLTSVRMGKTVTTIKPLAFMECEKLTDITDMSGVCSVGESAFEKTAWLEAQPSAVIVNDVLYRYCGEETSVTVPDGVRVIADYAFAYCRTPESVSLPDSVTAIGMCAFSYCTALTSFVIPKGVHTIPSDAFRGCKSLAQIVIPDGVTAIGSGAFVGCMHLISVDLPDSVTDIASEAFGEPTISGEIRTSEEVFRLVWGSLLSEDKTERCLSRLDGGYALHKCEERYVVRMTDRIVRETIRRGMANALVNALARKKTVSPERLDEWIAAAAQSPELCALLIGFKNKLYSAQKLEELETAETEKELGLRRRTVADWRKRFRFVDKDGEVTVTGIKTNDPFAEIPPMIGKAAVTSIRHRAMVGCSTLESVLLPDTLRSIGDYAFASCSRLREITLPDALQTVGKDPFSGCPMLCTIRASRATFELVWKEMKPETRETLCYHQLTAGEALHPCQKSYISRAIGRFVCRAIKHNSVAGLQEALSLKSSLSCRQLEAWIVQSKNSEAVRAFLEAYKAERFGA